MPASHCLNRRSNASCYLEFVWVWCVRFRVLFCSASDRARGHFGNRHHRPSGLTFFRQDAPVFNSSSSSNRLQSSRSSKKFETLKFWINFISADLKFFFVRRALAVLFSDFYRPMPDILEWLKFNLIWSIFERVFFSRYCPEFQPRLTWFARPDAYSGGPNELLSLPYASVKFTVWVLLCCEFAGRVCGNGIKVKPARKTLKLFTCSVLFVLV